MGSCRRDLHNTFRSTALISRRTPAAEDRAASRDAHPTWAHSALDADDRKTVTVSAGGGKSVVVGDVARAVQATARANKTAKLL